MAGIGTSRRLSIFLLAATGLSAPATAQDNATGSPPALEVPFQAQPSAPRAVALAFVRAAVERAADQQLCLILMRRDGKKGPTDANNQEQCLPDYGRIVAANQGFIRWAPNSRPISCTDCFGRPIMGQQDNRTEPNLRRATILARLSFESTLGPNRRITYPYRMHFTCNAPGGARAGRMLVDLQFDPPVIGEPGFWESLASFFTVGELSRFIDARIRQELRGIPRLQLDQGSCASVGTDLGDKALTDSVRFDPPPRPRPGGAAAIGDQAQIRLLGLRRKPLPGLVPSEHAAPGNPDAARFTLYINGAPSQLPALDLPVAGGSAPLNLCRTIDLAGRQRLQLLFVNGLGGAAWSDFRRTAAFGAGQGRTLGTGRTILLPAASGLPDPVSGTSAPGKPRPFALQEFDLVYEIRYMPRPGTVVASPGGRRPRPPVAMPGPRAAQVDTASAAPCQPF